MVAVPSVARRANWAPASPGYVREEAAAAVALMTGVALVILTLTAAPVV